MDNKQDSKLAELETPMGTFKTIQKSGHKETAENSCCTGCGLTLRPSLGRRRGLLRGASAQGLLVPSRTDPKSCDHTRGAALGMKTMLGLSIVQQWSSKQRKESIAGVSHCGFQDASR